MIKGNNRFFIYRGETVTLPRGRFLVMTDNDEMVFLERAPRRKPVKLGEAGKAMREKIKP